MRRLILFLLLVPGLMFAQTNGDYRTDQAGGNWGSATSWEVFFGGWQKLELPAAGPFQNIIPSSTSGAILIQHNLSVAASRSADQLTIAAGITLTISAAQTLTINDGIGDDLTNLGTITTTGSLVFSPSATYNHARNGGTIPLATWDSNSTCYITGITTTNPTIIPASAFQNFIWECNGQSGTRSLAGNLRTVNGSLLILDTSNQQLQFSTGVAFNLAIGGDFTVSGNSRIAFATTANPVNINLTGNFDFSVDPAAATSSLKSSGLYNFTIGGSFSQSNGTLTLSTGNNAGTINIAGDFLQSAGTITRTGGTGEIVFNGSGGAQNFTATGIISSIVNITATNTAGVVLNSDINLPSDLTQNTGSGQIDLNGNSLTINRNFTQTSGSLGTNTAAQFILQGSGTLSGSVGFSGTDILRLEINQTGTISTSSNVAIQNLNLLRGTLSTSSISIANGGLITVQSGAITATPGGINYNVLYTNTANINTGPELPASNTVLNNLTKQGTGIVTLNQALVTINGDLTLSSGTFALGANSVSLANNFVSNSTLTSSAGSTFTFTGSSATLTGSTSPTFTGLAVTGAFTPSIAYRVNGNYDVANGATVNPGGVLVTFGGTTIITNNGTMNLGAVTISNGNSMTAPSTTLGIAGDFTTPGTFNAGGGTILFNGTTNLTAAEVYNNITVSGTVTSTGNFSQTLGGNLINNGSFNISSVAGGGNLTWSGSGTLSGSGNTVVADITVSGTSLTYTATGNLTLNDDLLGAGSFDSSTSSGTIIFAGAGSAINRSGSTTFRSVSVTGSLTPTTSYTLTGAGGLDVGGTLISSSSVIFAGTNQTITGSSNAIAFNNFTTNVGSTLTISPNITINGNLVGNGNITSSGTITFITLTMSGTGTKNFNNVTVGVGNFTTNANYSIAGNLVITGTLVAGTGNVTFNGNTIVSGAGTAAFNAVTIINGSTLTGRLSSDPVLTFSGVFTNNGTFNGSSGTISTNSNIVNNGVFNGGTGTIAFTGNAAITISGTTPATFYNITRTNGTANPDLSFTTNQNLAGTLTLANNAIASSGGFLTLLSTSDSPAADGSIAALTGTSSITGNVSVQRYMSKEGGSVSPYTNGRIYRYISAPVLNPSVSQLQDDFYVTGTFSGANNGSTPGCTGCTTNPSLFSYDSSLPNYVAFPGGNLLRGVGYAAFIRNDLVPPGGGTANQPIVVDFTGTINSGAILAPSISSNSMVWNLVGNPYPSPIAWNNAGVGSSNIAAAIAVRDNGSIGSPLVPLTAGSKISTGQGFWVRANANGAAQLTFNEADKTTIAGTTFYREGSDLVDQISLKVVRNDGKYDETFLQINSSALNTLDTYDIPKKNGANDLNNDFLDITTVSQDGVSMLSNQVASIQCAQQINLNFEDQLENGTTDLATATFSISINPTGSLKAMTWTLHDNFNNTDIILSNGTTYDFSISTGTAGTLVKNRFYLTSAPASIDIAKELVASSFVCDNINGVVKIVNSQPNITYGAEINGEYYPNLAQGDGNDLSIEIDKNLLVSGANVIRIKANAGCYQQFLTKYLSLTKTSLYQVSSITGATLCSAGSATLLANSTSSDAIYNWYDKIDSSTPIATGAEFITPILSDSTNYFVAAVNSNGCEGDRVTTYVSIQDLSKALSVTPPAAVCKETSVTLTATTDIAGGTIKWYETMSSLSSIATGSEYVTPPLGASRSYYATYTNSSGCESTRVEVVVPVLNYAPLISVTGKSDVVCLGSIHELRVSGAPAGSTYQWFESTDATTPISTDEKLITYSLNSTTDYFVNAVSINGCVSERTKFTAKVDNASNAPTVAYSYNKICRDDETLVQLSNIDTNIKKYNWYANNSSLEILGEGTSYRTSNLSEPTSYFVSSVNSNGCESLNRKEIFVDVVKYPEPLIDSSTPGLLKSNFSTGNQWYLNNELLVGETSQTFQVKGTGDYDLKITYQGCEEFAGASNITTVITALEDKPQQISIYPNPSTDFLTIKVAVEVAVRTILLDDKGSLLQEILLTKTSDGWEGQLDVRSIAKGMYFLRINSENRYLTHKIIIK